MNSDPLRRWSGALPPHAIVMARKSNAALAIARDTSISVTGEGPADAALVFVGHEMAADAAQLLDRMLEAIGLSRAQVFIATLSESGETDLFPLLTGMAPRIVVALGEPATRALLGSEIAYASARGQFAEARGLKILSSLHPSELVQTPALKKAAWEDLKRVAAELGLALPGGARA